MPLTAFDHVNVRTANLDEMVAWYGEILEMHPGRRPDFNFPGAWLYLGDHALIHLIAVDKAPKAGGDATLEHFAFKATGMTEFTALLDTRAIDFTIDRVPGFPVVQVNFRDPDGNHIHVDFDVAEYDT
jgi:catechol 2,3-dioxygenase-like lactoylglutathione lyase family enzyme